jgi:hypothetical protein
LTWPIHPFTSLIRTSPPSGEKRRGELVSERRRYYNNDDSGAESFGAVAVIDVELGSGSTVADNVGEKGGGETAACWRS